MQIYSLYTVYHIYIYDIHGNICINVMHNIHVYSCIHVIHDTCNT